MYNLVRKSLEFEPIGGRKNMDLPYSIRTVLPLIIVAGIINFLSFFLRELLQVLKENFLVLVNFIYQFIFKYFFIIYNFIQDIYILRNFDPYKSNAFLVGLSLMMKLYI